MASSRFDGCSRGIEGIPSSQNYKFKFIKDQASIDAIKTELITKEDGSSITFYCDGYAIKMIKVNSRRITITKHDISKVKLSNIKGSISGTKLFDELTTRIGWSQSKTYIDSNIEEFEINLLNRGSKITVKNIVDKPIVVGWSIKNPTYYDLYMYTNSNNLYNYRSTGGYHSGDIGVGTGLIQFIRNMRNGTRCIIGVSGYSNNELKKYRVNNPFIVIIDFIILLN